MRKLYVVAAIMPAMLAGPAFAADTAAHYAANHHHARASRTPAACAGATLTQLGTASWYGHEHAGKPTASGAAFDPDVLTAAHRTLPLGTRVRVTHVASGRSVVVTINDRGPYVRGRIIDLSRHAAEQLGMATDGLATVRLDVM